MQEGEKPNNSYANYMEDKKDEQIPFMSDEAAVSLEILKVRAIDDDENFIFEEVDFEDDKGGKKKGWTKRRKNIPCLTGDLAVASLDSIDKAITSAQSSLCDRINAHEQKHKVDLSNFKNRIAGRHNYIVVQSRASGFGAQTAKTFNISQRLDKRQTLVEGAPEKKRGFMGFI